MKSLSPISPNINNVCIAGLQFVRVEGWVFAHVGDEGYVESCAADLTRYRRQLDAEHVLLFTDVKKKHRHETIETSLYSLLVCSEVISNSFIAKRTCISPVSGIFSLNLEKLLQFREVISH